MRESPQSELCVVGWLRCVYWNVHSSEVLAQTPESSSSCGKPSDPKHRDSRNTGHSTVDMRSSIHFNLRVTVIKIVDGCNYGFLVWSFAVCEYLEGDGALPWQLIVGISLAQLQPIAV